MFEKIRKFRVFETILGNFDRTKDVDFVNVANTCNDFEENLMYYRHEDINICMMNLLRII